MTTETTRPTDHGTAPIPDASAGPQLPASAMVLATPKVDSLERDQTTPQAMDVAAPNGSPPVGSKAARPTATTSTPMECSSAGSQLPAPAISGATPIETTLERDQATPRATAGPTPIVLPPVGSHTPPTPAMTQSTPQGLTLGLADPLLALSADVLDDLEKVRIANENRLRQLTRDEVDSDGEERGFGLTEADPDVARLAALVATLGQMEHQAALNLQRLMRKHPLGPWAKAQRGVGDKQIARLLAAIGDPYIRPELVRGDGTVEPSRPRTVSELWAYCGYHVMNFPADQTAHDTHTRAVGGEQAGHPDQGRADTQRAYVGVAPKRARGQKANWSANAKMRAYLVAESTLKQLNKATCPVDVDLKAATHADDCACSPLRKVYDATKAKYADAIHKAPCTRCGPSGKPAQAGSPLSDGHKHARALRAVSKELLKELWRESKRLHEEAAVMHLLKAAGDAVDPSDGLTRIRRETQAPPTPSERSH